METQSKLHASCSAQYPTEQLHYPCSATLSSSAKHKTILQFGSVIEKIKEIWDHTQNTVPCHNQPRALSVEQKHFDTGKKKEDMLVTNLQW